MERKLKILFLGTYIPDNKILKYQQISSFIDFPGFALQNNLFMGFQENADVRAITVPTLHTGIKHLIIKGYDYQWGDVKYNKSISYINVHGIKELISIHKGYVEFKSMDFVPDIIFVYSMSVENNFLALKIKKKYPQTKIVNIITDLPDNMSSGGSWLHHKLKSLEYKILMAQTSKFDAFVLLSKYMQEKLPISGKPYIVMEGIYGDSFIEHAPFSSNKTIMYIGNLTERYGVNNLIDAFLSIKNDNYKLLLRGEGNNPYVSEKIKSEDNIVLLPRLSRKEILELESKATVLVNPIPPSVQLTRYYFPSKTMEYLASGTPTIMYKLDCMPDDYSPYIIYLRSEKADELANRIKDICELPSEKLSEIGKRASDFIRKEKNRRSQTNKILEFVINITNA